MGFLSQLTFSIEEKSFIYMNSNDKYTALKIISSIKISKRLITKNDVSITLEPAQSNYLYKIQKFVSYQ